MASQGFNLPQAGANVGSGTAWTNPGNVISTNGLYAEVTVAQNTSSQFLRAANFLFSIPTGAIIDGIELEINDSENIPNNTGATILFVSKDGANFTGNQKSWTANNPAGAEVVGGPADLWGTTWTAAEINSSSFSFFLQWAKNAIQTSSTLYIDSVRAKVYYTLLTTQVAYDVRTRGQQTTSDPRDIRLRGTATSAAAWDVRVTTGVVTSTTRDARATGMIVSTINRDARLRGTKTAFLTNVSNNDAFPGGTTFGATLNTVTIDGLPLGTQPSTHPIILS